MRVLIPKEETAIIDDPSLTHRPELKYKDLINENSQKKFRNYEDNLQTLNVMNTYQQMHANQTVAFGIEKRKKWLKFDHAEMTILEAVNLLDNLVDSSDPDIDLPNSMHAFQTAEKIREIHPDKDWFQLTGLIHDLGKVMALWGEPQWCVVGDTFPVGCQFQPTCVFYKYFEENPDWNHPEYSTPNGIYKENCGLDQVMMSWGHDEYLYQVLKHNKATLPEEALNMIRYHSFYPYHASDSYKNLCNEKDALMLPWIQEFNLFDLYTKSDKLLDPKALQPYYQSLVDKYIPGFLKW
ncbi:inositol oxygenase isoform X2 [Hydra vulgaris]|uniref:Inositol oxygenase n=1 Tax=Hydra vulgaris TaxID=6087 RepID=A0ABM4CII5_HYDVU